jgi:hypothetical protein
MADQVIRTFNEDWTSRIQASVVRSEQARFLTSNRKRIPQPWIPEPDTSSTGGGGGAGGGCCCNGGICVPDKDKLGHSLGNPSVYHFALGAKANGGFNCGCTGDESGSGYVVVKATVPGGSIFESSGTLSCPDTRPGTQPCTVTATWTWSQSSNTGYCQGAARYQVILGGSGGTDPSWSFVGTINGGCHCNDGSAGDCTAVPPGPQDGSNPGSTDATGWTVGTTVDVTCVGSGCSDTITGTWQLTSTDAPDGCSCAPAVPDFNGSTNGQTAETTCASTISGPSETHFYDSKWRYTRGLVDYYGKVSCKLELIVGDSALIGYVSTGVVQCCAFCQHTLEISQCGPYPCSGVLTTVCMNPGYPIVKTETTVCDMVIELPAALNYALTPSADCTPTINMLNIDVPLISNDGHGGAVWESDWVKMAMASHDDRPFWGAPPGFWDDIPDSDLYLLAKVHIIAAADGPPKGCLKVYAYVELSPRRIGSSDAGYDLPATGLTTSGIIGDACQPTAYGHMFYSSNDISGANPTTISFCDCVQVADPLLTPGFPWMCGNVGGRCFDTAAGTATLLQTITPVLP